MSNSQTKPPPPEPKAGRWLYQMWEYVTRHFGVSNIDITGGTALQVLRINTAGDSAEWATLNNTPSIVGSSPILVTTGAGTATIAHDTSGVVAGTYGGTAGFARFDISSMGHVLSGTTIPAGPFAFNTSFISTGDVLGTTTTGTLTTALSTTGVAAGTYGTRAEAGGTVEYWMPEQIVVDNKGRLTSLANTPLKIRATVGGSNAWNTAPACRVLVAFGVDTNGIAELAPLSGLQISASGTGFVIGPFTVQTSLTVGTSPTNGTVADFMGIVQVGARVSGTATGLGGLIVLNRGLDDTAAWGIVISGTSANPTFRVRDQTQGNANRFELGADGVGTFGVGAAAALGSSASFGRVPAAGTAIGTAINARFGTGGATIFTLGNYSIPASALLGQGQGFQFTGWGTALTNLQRFAITLGTATLAVATSTGAPYFWQVAGEVLAGGNASQVFRGRFDVSLGPSSGAQSQAFQGTLGMDGSAAAVLAFVGTHGTNLVPGTFSQFGMTVDFRNS